MKFSRTSKPLFQIPEEGYYRATVVGWKEGKPRNTMLGVVPTAVLSFELSNGMRVAQSMLVVAGPNYLIDKTFSATVGPDVDEVDFDDLIGKVCGVEIKHNTVNGTTYANVVDVFPESELASEEDVGDENDWFDE
jgi:hypothetical protein